MNQSAYSVDHAYANMSTLVDKEKIVGANKKHLHQAGHAKLIQASPQVDESMNRSKFKKQMFASKEESMPKKGQEGEDEEEEKPLFLVNIKGEDGDLKEQLLYRRNQMHLLRESFHAGD
jgi:hypothetical protein